MLYGTLIVLAASGQEAPPPLVAVGVDVDSADTRQAIYEIFVANHGSGPAQAVRVSSDVPLETTFESATPSTAPPPGNPGGNPTCPNGGGREPAGTKCEWDLGDLQPGESRSILATYNLNQANKTTYTVNLRADVTSGSQSDFNIDKTLRRTRAPAADAVAVDSADIQDTFVDSSEPIHWGHGDCAHMRVQRGNLTTTYVDVTPLPPDGDIDGFWGAELRLNTQFTDFSPSAVGRIAAHRVTGPNWTEGTGDCGSSQANLTLGDTDARSGTEPPASNQATAVANVTAPGQVIKWDVTSDLNTEAKRASYQGWRLMDAGSSSAPPGGVVGFDAKETSAATQVSRLFVVHTLREAATCIDVDPETRTTSPAGVQRLTAYVTDGVRIPPGVVGTTNDDACNGAPVPGKQVIWTIEDDDPDMWISNRAGTPTTKTVDAGGDAQPKTVNTFADSNGKTFIEVRLDEPNTENQNTGENRVSGRLEGTPDVDETNEPDPCGIPMVLPCGPGEADNEDDVLVNWDPASTVTPTGSFSPSPSASPSPTECPSPSPDGSPAPSPTECPSPPPTCPSPTPVGSPSPTPSESPVPSPTECPSPSPSPSPSPELPQCSDGIDNDNDNVIDFPDDPDCESPLDDSELTPIDPRCNDEGVICGTDGDDMLVGTDGDDLIICGAGDDVVEAGKGDDVVLCMGGNNDVAGGGGADSIDGGNGNDRCAGGGGNDTIDCGPGDDIIIGGRGNDVLSSKGGSDRIKGGPGNDRLRGGGGNDSLSGGAGKDVLLGGARGDRLRGGKGNDVLKGGRGKDVLIGGPGTDTCRGGKGNDKKKSCEKGRG
jgi:hypothetical protein